MVYGFIVEGINDKLKVREVLPDALIVITRGTRFNGRVKIDLEELLRGCDEVLFSLTLMK